MLSPLWLEIVCGFKTVDVEGIKYDLLLPTLGVLHDSNFYIRQAKEDLVGIAYTAESLEYLQKDLLSEEDMALLDTYEEERAVLGRDLEVQSGVGKRQLIRKAIEKLEQRKTSVDTKWYRIISMSSEGYASIIQTYYCFFRCLRYHEDKSPAWDSYEEYLGENKAIYLKALMTEYLDFTSKFTDVPLRELARDGYYRVVHQVMKESLVSAFPTPKDTSLVAIKLLYWLSYYANVLQSASETCPKEILEDDSAFDIWAERQQHGITDTPSSSENVSRVRGKGKESIIVSG